MEGKKTKKEGLFHEFREFLYADSPRRSPPCALGYHGNKSGIVLRNKKTGDITFILKKVADEESIPSFLPRLWSSSRKQTTLIFQSGIRPSAPFQRVGATAARKVPLAELMRARDQRIVSIRSHDVIHLLDN